jgi:V8-like Glu-specific endopeptidase
MASLVEPVYCVTPEEMSKPLHKYIGALTCRTRRGKMIAGSGVLISPNLVLTGRSNILDPETKERAFDIRFFPGQCEEVGMCYESNLSFY